MSQKIVHVINDFPSKSETFIVNHIVETIKEGVEPHIVVNNLAPKEATSQLHLFNKYNLYEIATSYNMQIPKNKISRLFKAIFVLLTNIRYAHVFFKTLNSRKYGTKAKSLKMWFQVATFIKYHNFDLFHGHFAVCGQVLAQMKEIGAIKGAIVTTFYGYDTFSTEENRLKLKFDYRGIFKYSDLIITSSNYLANNLRLLNVPEDKIIVNPVGVDVDKFKFIDRKVHFPLKLVTVGRLIKLKGQHIGIKAVKSLIEKGHQVDYSIVGYGDEYKNLKNLISELRIENYVSLIETKTQKEVIEILNNSHLFLMTSITDENGRAEGQGLVTAEAQSTGIPAIGFNCGGIPETIQNNITGYIVEEGQIEELVNKIEMFITDITLINKMGIAGREYVVKEFNSKIQSKKIIDLYNLI
ncbi:glycosyltransferase [Winogradskyella vincentii]|uniref:Glycosyltransferase n=1 Tax=Winogradskyella vincentii TaxID=2877122 RepID=A0ABS7Y374_9FLAO|nr:glycosyltransferase [Winogradskyella vincentii]MCA0153720.1 glycosyltransferase [Winogradskyella vincentii]